MKYIKPNAIQILDLIKRVKKGDEDACDELYDIIDEISNLNIELINKIKMIGNICVK